MRRSSDGYISATGMFKASFPYAETAEEETERKYIKALKSTSPDETAGNVWIPPNHALVLAEEYRILPWIQALLDNTPIEVNSTKDATPKSISTPPRFDSQTFKPVEQVAATPSRARTRREASPEKKTAPPSARKIASTRRKTRASSASAEPKPSSLSTVEPTEEAIPAPDFKKAQVATVEEEDPDSVIKSTEEEDAFPVAKAKKEEDVVRVHIDQDVNVKGDVETTHTHLEVEMPAGAAELPLPEDPQAMIAKAQEMVAAALESERGNGVGITKKRKAAEVDEEDGDTAVVEAAPTKKVKVEADLKREKIKARAWMGLTATLAVG